MKHVVLVVLRLPLELDVRIAFANELEVTLDCAHCQRIDRTVIFKPGEGGAECRPGSGARPGERHPPYPGRIAAREVERTGKTVTVTYRLEYELDRFVDSRHGERRPWTGYPTWARVSWTITCPACKLEKKDSTQTNLVRPFTRRCTCGHVFLVESEPMPLIQLES